ncbi:hypothetical protein DBV15_07376 [Temnothorax longispinosus]|uniref:Uncharacterized protein n=1 Tax=Temnothorax longispinosus TaxID=300112 RepID=A0A4V3SC37_9HYME|nr:hypothetical protein DBV15_07376 [Temnothorax longispinosus]
MQERTGPQSRNISPPPAHRRPKFKPALYNAERLQGRPPSDRREESRGRSRTSGQVAVPKAEK